MFNFDVERYLNIQNGALSLKDQINHVVDTIVAKGFKNLFFIGSGGAGILTMPPAFILKMHSSVQVFTEIAAEFLVMNHKHFDENSVVILPSLSGTTQETVDVARYCKEKGATTISFVGNAGTPLAEITDYTFVNFAEDDTSCESFFIQFNLFIFRLMLQRNEFQEYDAFINELKTLPSNLVKVKEKTEKKAEEFAKTYQNESYHMFTGSGNTWGETCYYAMCILEEMQWIKTRPVHASDFFHGALELISEDVSLVVFKGEDETRPLTDRVEAFARQYTNKVTIFDTKEYELEGISEKFRGFLSPIILAAALERVSAHLEHLRNHPLTIRRYYRRVKY